MPAHVIRLVGPWQVQWLSTPPPPDGFATAQSVRMPRDWQSLFGPLAGRAQFVRTFHSPSGLTPLERVFLECTGIRGTGVVRLNATNLGTIAAGAAAARIDITAALRPYNTLTVELSFNPAGTDEPGGLFDVVRLVIESESGN
jgi:hypothetical protein